MQPAATADVTAGEIIAAFGVSVTTPFLLTGLIAPAMAQRGDGAIVNIGSISGIIGAEGSARSTQWHPARSPLNATKSSPTPSRRSWPACLAPDEHRRRVASAVVFLTGPQADNIQGTILTVDGGATAV